LCAEKSQKYNASTSALVRQIGQSHCLNFDCILRCLAAYWYM